MSDIGFSDNSPQTDAFIRITKILEAMNGNIKMLTSGLAEAHTKINDLTEQLEELKTKVNKK